MTNFWTSNNQVVVVLFMTLTKNSNTWGSIVAIPGSQLAEPPPPLLCEVMRDRRHFPPVVARTDVRITFCSRHYLIYSPRSYKV